VLLAVRCIALFVAGAMDAAAPDGPRAWGEAGRGGGVGASHHDGEGHTGRQHSSGLEGDGAVAHRAALSPRGARWWGWWTMRRAPVQAPLIGGLGQEGVAR